MFASSGDLWQRPEMLLNSCNDRTALHSEDTPGPQISAGQCYKALLQALCFYWTVPGSVASTPLGGSSVLEPSGFIRFPFRTQGAVPPKPCSEIGISAFCPSWVYMQLLGKAPEKVRLYNVSNFYSLLELDWAYLRIYPHFSKISLFRD